jgi:hypothetical protein
MPIGPTSPVSPRYRWIRCCTSASTWAIKRAQRGLEGTGQRAAAERVDEALRSADAGVEHQGDRHEVPVAAVVVEVMRSAVVDLVGASRASACTMAGWRCRRTGPCTEVGTAAKCTPRRY